MTAQIEIEQIAEHEFHVRVIEGAAETSHRVTLRTEGYDEIAGGKADPAALVRRAVELLLSREYPKPVPPECDLTILARYFAEFERAMRNTRLP